MTLVLDASMALSWIFRRTRKEEVDLANAALTIVGNETALVPYVWHSEVPNGLLVGERRRLLSEAETSGYLAMLSRLRIQTDDAEPVARREVVLDIARKYSLTAYDATYLDLALRHGCAIASFDGALVAAMRRAGGQVFGDNP